MTRSTCHETSEESKDGFLMKSGVPEPTSRLLDTKDLFPARLEDLRKPKENPPSTAKPLFFFLPLPGRSKRTPALANLNPIRVTINRFDRKSDQHLFRIKLLNENHSRRSLFARGLLYRLFARPLHRRPPAFINDAK